MPISPRVDDVSSDEDFDNRPRTRTLRKQRSFEDLVNNSPRSVATLLRRFHTRRDPKRYALVDELHNIIVVLDTPDDVMDGFIDSELPSLLMEIASDRSTYGKFRHDKNAERYGVHIIRCLGSLLGSNKIGSSSSTIDSLLNMSPKLWKTLWNKRTLLYDPEPFLYEGRSRQYLSASVILLGGLLYVVHGHRSHRNELKDPSYLAHFMLYSWIMYCEHRFIALNIVHKIFCQNRDEGWRRLFFTEALGETDLVEKFCDAAREELEDSDVVGNDLYEVLVIHHFACKYCYPVLRHEAATPPSGQKSTVQNIAIACQREFCMGREEDLLNNFSAGFMTIPTLIEHNREFHRDLYKDQMEEMQLIPMCAKLFPLAAASCQFEFADPLSKLFSLYACHYGKDDQRNPEFAAQAKAAIFLVWRSTLEDLQRVPLDEHGFIDSCKETWVGFGQDIGLDPATHNEEEDALLKAHASRHIRTKRCQHRDCMCSTHPPTHKMKICTGCWRAGYCSTKCQASDWQAGHRDVCTGYPDPDL